MPKRACISEEEEHGLSFKTLLFDGHLSEGCQWKPLLGNWDDKQRARTAFQDLTCFHTEELLDMKSLAAACPRLPYCPTHR